MSTLEQRVAVLEAALGIKEVTQPSGIVLRQRAEEWPQLDDKYFLVLDDGSVGQVTCLNNGFDAERKAIGNMYRTQAEAKAEVSRRKTMTKLREIAARLNGDWVPDWSNKEEWKYYISYDVEKDEFVVVSCWVKKQMGQFYFNTMYRAQKALNELGDELKGLFV